MTPLLGLLLRVGSGSPSREQNWTDDVPEYRIDPTGIERPPSEFQIGYTAMPVMC